MCENAHGVLLGAAAWQAPWATLDLHLRPGAQELKVADLLLEWAMSRFRALDLDRGHPLPYWVEVAADDADRRGMLERHGYVLDDDPDYLSLSRPVSGGVPVREPPPAFTLRPLRGAEEVDAYVALHRAAFQSDSMTVDWRARTFQSPEYHADLDLVAVAPDGALAGFCVCWLGRDGRCGQIEPVGVHPRHQGLGLAGALMSECFRRLHERRVDVVRVETGTTRTAAVRAYESLGFRPTHRIHRRGRWSATEDRPGDRDS